MRHDGKLLQLKLLLLFQDNKADVILKYNADEARSLKAYGELPEHGELHLRSPHLRSPHLCRLQRAEEMS